MRSTGAAAAVSPTSNLFLGSGFFDYAGADRVWKPVWRGERQLPKAIRVQVRDVATDRTLAVSTATVVRADMPADCVFAEVVADRIDSRVTQQNPG